MGFDGLIRYAYRGPDRDASDNRALRAAFREGVPLAYFVGVDRGVYRPIYPVWIVHDEPANLRVAVAVDTAQTTLFGVAEPAAREYAARMTKARLHQPVFRSQVLRAYSDSCAMCRLKHPELLDAAHIIPDGEQGGEPVVPNGLSLCKLHHSAFDSNILGVRPDRIIEVRRDVLDELDGPMLRHGLQELDGQQLGRPNQALALPDPRRLEVRYERFLRAS